MSHERPLVFETLEVRKLLSTARAAAAHARPKDVASPLVLNGTLSVDSKAASTIMNADGSMTTSTPVSGQLGSLGPVRGSWQTTEDEYGDYEGPDTIQLRASKGTIVIAFSDATNGAASRNANGTISYEHPQIFDAGTKAYSRGSESGSIVLTTNAAHKLIESMTLTTTSK